MKGTVKRWMEIGGYGFITADEDNKDYFTHKKYMIDKSYTPSEGDVVEFNTATSDRGIYCFDVKLYKELENVETEEV